MAVFERALSLWRVPGNGPLVMRIGGDSTDHALYDVHVSRAPRGVYELSPAWFRKARVVVSHADARVLIDLNLVTDLPGMAAQWALAGQRQLRRGSIEGYEIGNEPDLYKPSFWSRVFSTIMSILDIRLFAHGMTPATYVQLFESYASGLARYAPGVPLVAPVIAYPTRHLDWIASLLAAPHPALGMISAHMYPYSACVRSRSRTYPTIPRLLSERATAGMAASLRPAVDLAHSAGLPFRLTEVNSVTCGGVAGVSDTFVTALWAPDAMFELLRAGVDDGAGDGRAPARAFAQGALPRDSRRPAPRHRWPLARATGPRDGHTRAPRLRACRSRAERRRGGRQASSGSARAQRCRLIPLWGLRSPIG
jgi:hypothetical protein